MSLLRRCQSSSRICQLISNLAFLLLDFSLFLLFTLSRWKNEDASVKAYYQEEARKHRMEFMNENPNAYKMKNKRSSEYYANRRNTGIKCFHSIDSDEPITNEPALPGMTIESRPDSPYPQLRVNLEASYSSAITFKDHF